MAIQIQIRRGTALEWATANTLLAEGELAAELDTGRFKIGNGITLWNDLVYSSGPAGIQGPIGPQGPQGIPGNQINKVTEIPDVVSTNISDGSVLVYNEMLNNWNTTRILPEQNLDGGHF